MGRAMMPVCILAISALCASLLVACDQTAVDKHASIETSQRDMIERAMERMQRLLELGKTRCRGDCDLMHDRRLLQIQSMPEMNDLCTN